MLYMCPLPYSQHNSPREHCCEYVCVCVLAYACTCFCVCVWAYVHTIYTLVSAFCPVTRLRTYHSSTHNTYHLFFFFFFTGISPIIQSETCRGSSVGVNKSPPYCMNNRTTHKPYNERKEQKRMLENWTCVRWSARYFSVATTLLLWKFCSSKSVWNDN